MSTDEVEIINKEGAANIPQTGTDLKEFSHKVEAEGDQTIFSVVIFLLTETIIME